MPPYNKEVIKMNDNKTKPLPFMEAASFLCQFTKCVPQLTNCNLKSAIVIMVHREVICT